MNVLVTGGLGFIGSHVADRFLSRGDNVSIIDINFAGQKQLYNYNYLTEKHGSLYKDGLAYTPTQDFNLSIYSWEKPDLIVHCAGQTAVTHSIEDPRNDLMSNVVGTFNMLEIARKHDAKFIYTSTNKVYGDNVNKVATRAFGKRYMFDGGFTVDEVFPIDQCTHTPYGVSKLAADLYVQDYRHTYGLQTDILRMSCIYGERQFGTEDQGWLAHFVFQALKDLPITIYGDGKQVRDVLYISELVDLIEIMADSEISGVYNVGGGRDISLSLLELIDILEETLDKNIIPQWGSWRQADQKVYVSNLAKVYKVFGWLPEITPTEGVERLVEWAKTTL